MTDFSEAHAAGKHQDEIVSILAALDPCMHDHSRRINTIALVRMIAVQLGPASDETREAFIEAIPPTLRLILAEMDRMFHGQSASAPNKQ